MGGVGLREHLRTQVGDCNVETMSKGSSMRSLKPRTLRNQVFLGDRTDTSEDCVQIHQSYTRLRALKLTENLNEKQR
jgi:hypothetical protein